MNEVERENEEENEKKKSSIYTEHISTLKNEWSLLFSSIKKLPFSEMKIPEWK